MTEGLKEGEIYMSLRNHDQWLSPQMTHKVEYALRYCGTNQKPKQ